MEIIIYALMLFVALNCVFKLSMWAWWQRLIYSALLGGFTFWSQRYAILQSKTQIADYLQNTEALQTMAILATIETVCCFAYIYTELEKKHNTPNSTLITSLYALTKWYASLLMFPVMFYVLTQLIFTAVGVDFTITAAALAVAVVVGLPLLAEGARWLLPEAEGRIELQVLLSAFVCILGLISTETGKMIYKGQENPIDWRMVSFAAAVFVVLFLAGFAWSKWKWRLLKK